jgi:iron complex transport system ATP-binding protein
LSSYIPAQTIRQGVGDLLPPLIELSNVTVIRGDRAALNDVSLTIRTGEHVAVLGPNGCGKSTLIKLINRELYPVAGVGSIRILGQKRWNVADLRSHLGIVANDLQSQISPEASVIEAVVTGFTGKLGVFWVEATDDRIEAARRALLAADADHLAERLFGSLSSGEGRRVLIARALVHDPGALLLDEPTTSLDLASAHSLLQTLRCLAHVGKTLVLVTHHLEEILPDIERVVLLREGQVMADGPKEAVLTEENLSALFGTAISIDSRDPYRARVAE